MGSGYSFETARRKLKFEDRYSWFLKCHPSFPLSKQPLSLVKQRSNQAAENSQAALD